MVTFVGNTTDVASLYAAADCFALPTRYDTFSLATLEAMASGLPVIVSRAADDHWQARCHRFQRRQAECVVSSWEREAVRRRIEGRYVGGVTHERDHLLEAFLDRKSVV